MKRQLYIILMSAAALVCSCTDEESYSNLLRDEEKATNWWLSSQRVVPEVPVDSVFEIGEDAPFYRMDPDGYIYMQVINPGDRASLTPKTGDLVYFRFKRQNLKYLYNDIDAPFEGNADDMSYAATSFIFGNTSSSSTSSVSFGSGIQMPLSYLGYNSEVNLVLRSYYGFSTDQTSCTPYLVNVRYFKAEY